MDLVPCHTSIEHPWFRDHPDWYIWSPVDGPPNNWVAAFGGPAWSRHEPSGALVPALVLPRAAGPRLAQPRGGGGDAGRRPLLDRPRRGRLPPRRARPADQGRPAARRPARERAFRPAAARRVREARAPLLGQPSRDPARRSASCARRRATRCSWARSSFPSAKVTPYLEHLDLAFAFELFHSPWEKDALARAIEGAAALDRGAPPPPRG